MEEDEDSVILDTWISVLRPSVLPLSRFGDPPSLDSELGWTKELRFFFFRFYFFRFFLLGGYS